MDAADVARIWAGKAEPILPTTSIERIVDFWSQLGFMTGVWEDDKGYAWVHSGADRTGVYIDYSLAEDLHPFMSSGMAYLTVPDVDQVYTAISSADVALEALTDDGLFRYKLTELHERWERGESLARYTRPINQTWGKREMALFDPDNNLIRIGSAL